METPAPVRPPFERRLDDRVIAGVCSGLATHLGLPVKWVRLGFIAGVFVAGATVVLYLFFLLTVPQVGESPEVTPLRRVFTPPADRPGEQFREHGASGPDVESEAEAQRPRPRIPVAELLLGGSLLIAGLGLLLVQLGVAVRLEVLLPGLAVLVGLGLTWWLIIDRNRSEARLVPRVLGALALVAVGVIMFFVTAREPTITSVVGAALAVLAGVALAIAPWLLRLNRELGAERAARAREAERAEIAAHLHDSVLQTLAMIQQRSDPATEVARLARLQERELREWLFRAADGESLVERDSATAELEAHASMLEAEYAVRFEVVTVGERVVAPEAIIAAAREAMHNAARHAGGEVSVYVETGAEAIRIEVNDRGPGFDLDQIDGARFGVRESILGRMERAGGTATVQAGPGGRGSSVRLDIERAAAKGAHDE